LADRTIQDVLLHFGETKKVARRRYRQFVKNGIDQGKRPELQGGGLVRSSGGEKAGLLGRRKEEREKGDSRILGSGDFVSRTLHESNKAFEKRNLQRPTIKAIIDEVISQFKISPVALFSGSRNGQVSKARAVISYLTVKEAGYTQKEVSTGLNVSRIAVRNSLIRGEKDVDMCKQIWAKIG
jgi:putative transposase